MIEEVLMNPPFCDKGGRLSFLLGCLVGAEQ